MKNEKDLKKEFDELSLKYSTIYTLILPITDREDSEFSTLYLKTIDRDTMSAIRKIASGADPYRAIELALKNLYVGGDNLEDVLKSDEAILTAEQYIMEIMEKKRGSLKKN